jgi:putative Holliday junction resolvase
MRCLGLDIGDRRIGVAMSDPSGILASPLTIIERGEDRAAIDAIINIVKENEVGRVIAGLPRSLDGSVGSQAQKVIDFADKLRAVLPVPLEFRDERLSTVSARRGMKESMSKKARRETKDDALAAAVILQNYLEEGRPD